MSRVRNHSKNADPIVLLVLVALVLASLVLAGCGGVDTPAAHAEEMAATAASAADSAPSYNAEGELIRPEGFHRWIFVGSNMGLGYRQGVAVTEAEAMRNLPTAAGGQTFHNVYLSPEAYEHYVTHKTFPERTVLVMDKYLAQEKEPQDIVDRGYFDGDFAGFEVAVKNSDRPDGGKVPWAYYRFELDSSGGLPASAPAQPNSHCYDCHKAHADFDNVWVQFYPVIRDVNPPSGS